MLALLALLNTAPKVMALDQTSQAIDLAQREVIAQQKRQDVQLKAIENHATKLLQQENNDSVKANRK